MVARGFTAAMLALTLTLPSVGHAAAMATCESLAKLALPDATITAAQSVGAGQYKMPEGPMARLGRLPGMNLAGHIEEQPNPVFCRVAATLKPSDDSDIRIEVWLPQSGWNGKFLGVGNFGWAGSLMTSGMLSGLAEGYVTASTDTGHDSSAPDGDGGRFALGHSNKLIDYAYRADHLMTLAAKTMIEAFYGAAPSRSYWIGCSLGGLQGLIEIKRYPADYDGVVVGAPPNPLTSFNAAQLWPGWLVSQDPSRLIPNAKYGMIHDAVLKACASPVGLKDGLVDQPDRCSFDPDRLRCTGADAPDCLTAPQVYLMQQIYLGPVNPRTRAVIFPGPARGSELDLSIFATAKPFGTALDLFRYAAFQNPDWDWTRMDWDKDVATAIAEVAPLLHVDADLKPFLDRGGKLLMYIGWNDYHNPEELIGYYTSLVESAGPRAGASTRLFTIPGMGHCFGGAGCDTFDKLGAIDAWVDHGEAPERVLAFKVRDGTIVRTRPLCAYPKAARYNGSGDTSDAANFVCAAR
jgi:feruloyl esterase